MNSYERLLEALRDAGCHVAERGDRAYAQAPGHTPADRSLSIRYEPAVGKVLLHSYADDTADVLTALGLGLSDLFDVPLSRTEARPVRAPRANPVRRPLTDMQLQHRAEHMRELREADRVAAAENGYTVAQIRAERARLIEMGEDL